MSDEVRPRRVPIQVYNWKTIPSRELRQGITHRDFRGDNVVVAHSIIRTDFEPKPHRHPQEQIFMILEGEVKLHIEDQVLDCPAGTIVRIPPNALHWAEPPKSGHVVNLDVWTPYREDYGQHTSYQ